MDLNVDVGEGFGWDDELFAVATTANVACGAHAADWQHARLTLQRARTAGLAVAAHPGYPDRASMGRRLPTDEERGGWLESVVSQLRRFFEEAEGDAVKLHGALYNDEHPEVVRVLAPVLREIGRPLVGLPGVHADLAKEAQIALIPEGFADRRRTADGRLSPRSEPGAVLHAEAEVLANVLAQADGVATICVHGDHEGCVERARSVRRCLEASGREVRRVV